MKPDILKVTTCKVGSMYTQNLPLAQNVSFDVPATAIKTQLLDWEELPFKANTLENCVLS